MATASRARSLVELRLLDGPNLYFPRPAAKVTLDLTELLELPEVAARDLGTELGLGKARTGTSGTIFRQRFAIRLVTQIVRRLARAGGTTRLAVRTRTGQAVTELVVAYPWRNAGRAEALAYGLARVLDSVAAGPHGVEEMISAEGAVLAATPPGAAPRLIRPSIPVVAITGTNGKTTTARMIGHVARRAGLSVGWSSTDGVYIDGELIEAGDFSGPGGAVIFISHKLDEVLEISDRISILRGGRKIATEKTADCNPRMLAKLMVGRDIVLADMRQRAADAAPVSREPVLGLNEVSALNDAGDEALHSVSLQVHAGEILELG